MTERLEALRGLFPEAFVDGRLEVARLLEALGEGGDRYGLGWAGKAESARAARAPSPGALLPAPAESVGFEDAGHVFIEGDNLEVLKLLQRAYAGRVKLIFIDPPYNTGGDFVYPDDFRDGLRAYMAMTGQADRAGQRLSTLAETDGRFHSRWLSMMHPRLLLARRLLARDGFLFVTIDDHEVHTLRMLLGEVFGEENFVAHVIWQKKYTRSNDARFFSATHDHVLVFARDREAASLNMLPRTDAQRAAYSNPDGHPKGPWKATPLHARSGRVKDFSYTFCNGVTWSPPPGTYPRYARETLAALEAEDAIWFGADGTAVPSRKSFLADVKEGLTPTTIWTHQEAGHTHEANQELKDLIGEGAFDTPKPTRLIRRILDLATGPDEGALVLDFFAGSGTTGQAVLAQNAEDGGNRRFVLVQLPEPTGDARYPTIAEVAKERLRKAGGSFRVFKLGGSAFKPWRAEGDLAAALEDSVEALRPEREPLSVVFELLQAEGLPLTARVEEVALSGSRFFEVEGGSLLVCLEREVAPAAWEAALARRPRTLVACESAFAGAEAERANLALEARRRGVSLRIL